MPLVKVQIAPGVDKQDTEYGAEGRWTNTDNVRFRYGLPEKIGGWAKVTSDALVERQGVSLHGSLSTATSTQLQEQTRNFMSTRTEHGVTSRLFVPLILPLQVLLQPLLATIR